MKLTTTFFFFTLFSAATFAQSSNQVVVSFDHKAGAVPLVLNETIFPIWNGKLLEMSRSEFYISEIELMQADSSTVALNDVHLLVDAEEPSAEFETGEWPVENVIGITLHLGVDAVHNHLDPSSYPADHPLAPQNPSMHWGWTAGYRFMAVEGKVDNNGDGVPESVFEFHNLGDALYKTVKLSGTAQAENGVLHLHFTLDHAKLFEGMGMTGNLIQHGSSNFNDKMMGSAADAGFISMSQVTGTNDAAANAPLVSTEPNPFAETTLIRYDLRTEKPLALHIVDMTGRRVRTFDDLPGKGVLRFEAEALPNGIYRYTFFENGRALAGGQLIVGR